MRNIQAKVNERLLTKASRLFTGTLAGRIIEILQNARRAGATHVSVTNQDGLVTVRDNGSGVQDFAALLDLGGSNWLPPDSPPPPDLPPDLPPDTGSVPRTDLEASEDPAGVGLFCLAPRQVTIRSSGLTATIEAEGWTGGTVEVREDPRQLPAIEPGIAPRGGTELQFTDEPWDMGAVGRLAVFTGMTVTVDGEVCPQEQFITGDPAASAHFRGLGCRIKVVGGTEINHWHRDAFVGGATYSHNVLVNFHGQVVSWSYSPVGNHNLVFLVDLTGEPTGIRLMLPARTQLVENTALEELRGALEREAFLYLQRQGWHKLPYKQWLRAKALGIELPEAALTYQVGLLNSDMSPEPVEVIKPDDHPLSRCYRLNPAVDGGDETDEANAHLLAALGKFDEPFIPVDIRSEFDGYSWANLSTINQVEVKVGKTLLESYAGSGQIVAVQSLSITAHTSDGKEFTSSVSLAVIPSGQRGEEKNSWWNDQSVYVTQAARSLRTTEIWHHLGGWNDEGDSYDTQESQFSEELDRFWAQLVGPDEPLRVKLMECVSGLKENWRAITIRSDGSVALQFEDGSGKEIKPPADTRPELPEINPGAGTHPGAGAEQ